MTRFPPIRRLFRVPEPDEGRLARDVETEIELHIDLRTEQLTQRGLSPEAARAEALRRFGSVEATRAHLHSTAVLREQRMRIRESLAAVGQDVRHAVRGILREPAVSTVVVASLALGIGANAAVFGMVDRLLLSGPEHVREADRVVRLYLTTQSSFSGEDTGAQAPYPLYEAIHRSVRSYQAVAAFSPRGARVIGGTDGVEVQVAASTWNLFPLLGTKPFVGRFFFEEEDRPPQGEYVAVLGHSFWRRRFGSDPGVIGETLALGAVEYTIVGVAQPGFTGPQFEPVDVWIPLAASGLQPRQWTNWNSRGLQVIGRLAPGTTIDGAAAEVDAVYRSVMPSDRMWLQQSPSLSLAPIRFDREGREPLEARVSKWLLGVSLILLLVACANVSSINLARDVRRDREAAVRLALGGGRGRLVRAALSHALVLALAGGALALLVAHGSNLLLRRLLAPTAAWETAPIDGRVLAFAFLTTIAAAVLIGILPALQGARRDLGAALRTGGSPRGVRHARLLGGLTVAQTGAATVLLVGAGLFARSLGNVLAIPLGIEPDEVWIATPANGGAAAADRFYEEAPSRLQNHPAVEGIALSIGMPFWSTFSVGLQVPGVDSLPEMPGGGPYVSAVSSGYFATVGTRLLSGRLFTPEEGAASDRVALVNEMMAEALWPGENPLGKCLMRSAGESPCSRVVGVVEDAKRSSLHDEAAMQWYQPLGQERGIGGYSLLIRPRGDPASALAEIRTTLEQIAGPAVFVRLTPLRDLVDPEIRPWRAAATLFSVFGGLALAVAAFGLYGLIAYTVAQRTHEVGLRMALGARAAQVGGMVLRDGLALVLLGIAAGLAVTLALRPLVGLALFGASPTDPGVLAAAAAVLLLAAVVAALVPSLRAASVDPLVALRAE